MQALEVAQKYYGEDSKELIPIYQCLARAESSQGDASSHERATKLLLLAHDLSKARYITGTFKRCPYTKRLSSLRVHKIVPMFSLVYLFIAC